MGTLGQTDWHGPVATVLEHQDARFEEGMLIGVEAFPARSGVGNAGFEQNHLVTVDGLELVTKTPLIRHDRQTPVPEMAPDQESA